MFHGARILVAPLDWGLGHSTRCIPVIRRLIALGATPIIGADAGPLALLRKEFPDLEHVRIPGVNIRYAAGRSQLWSMARQFPAMVRSVQAEKALFDRIRQDLRLDAVISDQRFGIRHADLPSVLITHQVFPFTPLAQGALRALNLRHIARFDKCWIKDEPASPGLAGELSHGPHLPANARYIGTLSRMSPDGPTPREPYRIVAVFSGPEPQRTLLEQLLAERLPNIPGRHLMVVGLPGDAPAQEQGNVTMVPHLSADDLATHLRSAALIVSRSGYTTLMDLVALGRTALVVPTPGQAEQEYLGRLHARTGRFMVQQQDELDLERALDRVDSGLVSRPRYTHPLLDTALAELAGMLHHTPERITSAHP
jgi:predicted glycosyltransferase